MENIASNEELIRFALEIPLGSDDESGDSEDDFRIEHEPVFYNDQNENEHRPTSSTGTQNDNFIPNIDHTIPETLSDLSFDNNIMDGLEDLLPLINPQITLEQPPPQKSTEQNVGRPKTAPCNAQIQPPVHSYTNVNWKSGNFILDKSFTKFLGTSSLPIEIKNLISPLDFFSYFFDDKLLNKIIEETQLYSVQQNVNTTFRLTKNELKKFLGVIVLTSLIHLPDTRSFWHCILGNNLIQETMSLKQFELIHRYLHFNNNENILPQSHENHDCLHKIRPLLEHLKEKCNVIPLEENLSIDEQICPTKARSFLKQYLPLKPHKWGYKIFVLCGLFGFSYNFEV